MLYSQAKSPRLVIMAFGGARDFNLRKGDSGVSAGDSRTQNMLLVSLLVQCPVAIALHEP